MKSSETVKLGINLPSISFDTWKKKCILRQAFLLLLSRCCLDGGSGGRRCRRLLLVLVRFFSFCSSLVRFNYDINK